MMRRYGCAHVHGTMTRPLHIGLLSAMPEEIGSDLGHLETVGEQHHGDLTLHRCFWRVADAAPVQLTLAWSGWILLVHVAEQVSTAKVFQHWNHQDNRTIDVQCIDHILKARCAEQITPYLFNDLEPSVFRLYPAVADIYSKLNHLSMGRFSLTGAGSVFYQLMDDQEATQQKANVIQKELPEVNCTVVSGPAKIHPGN